MSKSELRTHFCALRECLPPDEVASASAALCQRLAAWLPSQLTNYPTNQTNILTYLAFRNEPDLNSLFELLSHVCWAIPRIEGKHLVLHPYDPARLMRHRFGMLEPAPDLAVVDPGTLDVVLVPGVAFDRRGARLGFGGGYYDRFLPSTPAPRVGIAFDECLADELPCGQHDQRMDWVVTPSQIIHCAYSWRTDCRPR